MKTKKIYECLLGSLKKQRKLDTLLSRTFHSITLWEEQIKMPHSGCGAECVRRACMQWAHLYFSGHPFFHSLVIFRMSDAQCLQLSFPLPTPISYWFSNLFCIYVCMCMHNPAYIFLLCQILFLVDTAESNSGLDSVVL